jgi:hypothetical protein
MVDPKNLDAYELLSSCQKEQGKYEDALSSCDKLVEIDPTIAEVHCNRAYILNKLRRYQEALESCDRALAIDSTFADAHLNRGNSLQNVKRYDEAIAAYDKALGIKADLESAWVGRGNVFYDLKRYDEAIAAYDKALGIKADLESAWVGRGNVFFNLNRDSEALQCYEKSITLKQDFAEAYHNKARLKLSLGQYEEGWKLYEWRWKSRHNTSPNRNFSQSLWLNDSDIAGKTLLIHAEQGFGDTIQFCRYLRLLPSKHCKVIFEVQKPLASLFQSQGLQFEIIAKGERIRPFDVHCPLLSLPLAFNTTDSTIPADVPYIESLSDKTLEWSDRIGRQTKPRIGIAWSGNPNFRNDISRPIPLSTLRSIMSDKFEWYCLQKDLRENDRDALKALPFVKDFSLLFTDFSDTAALIQQLHLVISVDTSIAHLAGAMAKPVWILLPFHPDFRWLRERADSPWYPTARLYRQSNDGDWTDVIERVSVDLKAFGAVN